MIQSINSTCKKKIEGVHPTLGTRLNDIHSRILSPFFSKSRSRVCAIASVMCVAACYLICAAGFAQTTTPVTNLNDGSLYSIPKYSGSSTLTNSAVFETNGNVGIGTSSPAFKFDVNGAINVAQGSAYNYAGVFTIIGQPFAGNWFFGTSGNLTNTGYANLGFGFGALSSLTSGAQNAAVGSSALQRVTSGASNIGIGSNTASSVTTGYNNLAVGANSLAYNVSGNGNIALGANSGYYETGSNTFYVNNNDQSNSANEKTYSLLYGKFSGAGSYLVGQQLTVNGAFNVNGGASIGNGYVGATAPDNGALIQGKVGIGTTTPAEALEVVGNLKLDSIGNYIEFPDGSKLWSANGLSAGMDNLSTLSVQGPNTGLVVSGANLDPAQGYSLAPLENSGKLLLGWNFSGGLGEQDFIGNRGTGSSGGFNFYDYSNVGVSNPLFTITGTGNVGIGTNSPGQGLQIQNSSGTLASYNPAGAVLQVSGTVALTTNSGGAILYSDGTVQSTAWNGTTLGGDYAESVDVTGDRASYEPGDVIVISNEGRGRFGKSVYPYSRMVAGVFSTKPGLIGRRLTASRPDKANEVPMAMLGIAPTKVTTENGPIECGDLLVTSSTPGYAMRGSDQNRLTGAIIGKALEPLQFGKSVIEVLLALQ